MKATEKKLLLIRINDSYSFDIELYKLLQNSIDKQKPLFYEFMNPGTFLIYFKPNVNKSKIGTLIKILTTNLESHSDKLEKSTISKVVTEFTCEIDWKGKIIFPVFGGNSIYKKENIIWTNRMESNS